MKKKLMIVFALFVLVSFVGAVYADCTTEGYKKEVKVGDNSYCTNDEGFTQDDYNPSTTPPTVRNGFKNLPPPGKFQTPPGATVNLPGGGTVSGEGTLNPDHSISFAGLPGGTIDGIPFLNSNNVKRNSDGSIEGVAGKNCLVGNTLLFEEGKPFKISGAGDVRDVNCNGCGVGIIQGAPQNYSFRFQQGTTVVPPEGGSLNVQEGSIVCKQGCYVEGGKEATVNGAVIKDVDKPISLVTTTNPNLPVPERAVVFVNYDDPSNRQLFVSNNDPGNYINVNIMPDYFGVEKGDTFTLSAFNGSLKLKSANGKPQLSMQGVTGTAVDQAKLYFDGKEVYGSDFTQGGNSVPVTVKFLDEKGDPITVGGEEWFVRFSNANIGECLSQVDEEGKPKTIADCAVDDSFTKPLDGISLFETWRSGDSTCFPEGVAQQAAPIGTATSFLGKAISWMTGKAATQPNPPPKCSGSCKPGAPANKGDQFKDETKCLKVKSSVDIITGMEKKDYCVSKVEYDGWYTQYSKQKIELDKLATNIDTSCRKLYSDITSVNVCKNAFMQKGCKNLDPNSQIEKYVCNPALGLSSYGAYPANLQVVKRLETNINNANVQLAKAEKDDQSVWKAKPGTTTVPTVSRPSTPPTTKLPETIKLGGKEQDVSGSFTDRSGNKYYILSYFTEDAAGHDVHPVMDKNGKIVGSYADTGYTTGTINLGSEPGVSVKVLQGLPFEMDDLNQYSWSSQFSSPDSEYKNAMKTEPTDEVEEKTGIVIGPRGRADINNIVTRNTQKGYREYDNLEGSPWYLYSDAKDTNDYKTEVKGEPVAIKIVYDNDPTYNWLTPTPVVTFYMIKVNGEWRACKEGEKPQKDENGNLDCTLENP
jgi:hypothetical protein